MARCYVPERDKSTYSTSGLAAAFGHDEQYGGWNHRIQIEGALAVNPIGRMWAFVCDLDLGARAADDRSMAAEIVQRDHGRTR